MTQVHDSSPGASSPAALHVLREFFDRMHAEGIRYCHWKSNEHLGPSMTGDTDIDILVDRAAAQRLAHLLTAGTSFKRFVVKPGHGYPGIEDYVGFDAATGALTHLHLHYQLTLGEKFIKGHRLPWEEVYLATRAFDQEHGIYVADPNIELLVLVIRSAIKVRLRDVVLEALGVPYLRGGLLRELRWLSDRVEPRRLRDVAAPLVGSEATSCLGDIATARQPSIRQLRRFARRAKPSLGEFRLFSSWGAALRMAAVEWSIVVWKLKHWYMGAATRSNRTVPQGGVSVALVGATGAGTTTLTREIAHWLSREVAVMTTYGGTGGGGPVPLPVRLLRALRLWPKPSGGHLERAAGPAARPSLWAVLRLARERRRRALRVRRATGRGMITISDQLSAHLLGDSGTEPGPRSGTEGRTGLWRLVARRVAAALELEELTPPDLVVRLEVSADVAARRRPDVPPNVLRAEIDLARQWDFPATTRVVDVNANQALSHVLREVQCAVWDRI